MDIYLTNKSTGERLRIPLLPDRLNIKTGAMVVAFNIIKTGEAKIPRGSTLTGISWNGLFPGSSMAYQPFVFDWQEPANIIAIIKRWQSSGDTLSIMVTDLSINEDVFVESFVYEYYGQGHASYTINLTKRIQLYVTTTPLPAIPVEQGKEEEKDEKEKQYGTVTASALNVRSGPGTNYKSYGTLSNGTKVEILGKEGNWYKISYAKGDGGIGWVSASYVKLNSSQSTASSKKPSTTRTPAKTPISLSDSIKTVNKAASGKVVDAFKNAVENLNKVAVSSTAHSATVNKIASTVGKAVSSSPALSAAAKSLNTLKTAAQKTISTLFGKK